METVKTIPEKIGVYKLDHDTVGFKKIFCYYEDGTSKNHIAKLLIPKGSTVVVPCELVSRGSGYDTVTVCSGPSNKLRTNNYRIMEIFSYKTKKIKSCNAIYNGDTSYKEGGSYISKLNVSTDEQCTEGLHFFRTESEAKDYFF